MLIILKNHGTDLHVGGNLAKNSARIFYEECNHDVHSSLPLSIKKNSFLFRARKQPKILTADGLANISP
jgi:hypothetical protein